MNYGMSATTLALAILYSAVPAAGQAGPRPADGMVLDGGEWRYPTVEEALHVLTLGRGEWRPLRTQDVHRPITAILRQQLGHDPAADLNGLADALADMILADRSPEGRVRRNAARALRAAASPGSDYGGTPHPKSFDALVRVYETRAAQVLAASGGEDPFLEARGSQREVLSLSLSDIYWADREGLGRDYVLELHERSSPPPDYCGLRRGGGVIGVTSEGEPLEFLQGDETNLALCREGEYSTWCIAGAPLYREVVRDAREEDARRHGVTLWEVSDGGTPKLPPGLDEGAARWFRLCNGY